MRCCYPVSSGRTGCGAGWCRQAPNTAQTPSHPIITQTRPIQLHFPCFQRTIVVLTTTMEVEIKWESTGLQVSSMYRLIIMTGEGDMEFCIRILMKDKY